MTYLLKLLFLTALALWVGSVGFFSLVAAPALFKYLSVVEAGKAVGVVIPRYYGFGYACGVVALASGLLLAWRNSSFLQWALIGVTGLMLAITLYTGLVHHPKVIRVKAQLHATSGLPTDTVIKNTFKRLHRQAVRMNGAVMILGGVALALTATRLAP